jgi:hypothetical protein
LKTNDGVRFKKIEKHNCLYYPLVNRLLKKTTTTQTTTTPQTTATTTQQQQKTTKATTRMSTRIPQTPLTEPPTEQQTPLTEPPTMIPDNDGDKSFLEEEWELHFLDWCQSIENIAERGDGSQNSLYAQRILRLSTHRKFELFQRCYRWDSWRRSQQIEG